MSAEWAFSSLFAVTIKLKVLLPTPLFAQINNQSVNQSINLLDLLYFSGYSASFYKQYAVRRNEMKWNWMDFLLSHHFWTFQNFTTQPTQIPAQMAQKLSKPRALFLMENHKCMLSSCTGTPVLICVVQKTSSASKWTNCSPNVAQIDHPHHRRLPVRNFPLRSFFFVSITNAHLLWRDVCVWCLSVCLSSQFLSEEATDKNDLWVIRKLIDSSCS